MVLDSINNIGFSGGPVVFFRNGLHHVCGIVTGYREEVRQVEMSDEDWRAELDAIYKENTGITFATDTSTVQKLIDSV
ncbi:hypothetical protein [Ruegeria sp. Alg231-54]|uniref:hypothetical protein n=1 Tax=Ruegeria sp. Alg231-54 TaxID=1922221 RepID=UPI000D5528BE|nr:hypothetical protein [Ruegeria sp. Alg231-54]